MTLKEWIKSHPYLWMVCVFFMGALLGVLQNFLLGISYPRTWILVSLGYGSILVITELSVGGEEF